MATRFVSRSLSRSLLATKHSLSRSTTSTSPLILRLRPISAVAAHFSRVSPAAAARLYSTRQTNSSLSDPSPNWSNRPPKETILLDGCDFEHWLVVVEAPTHRDITRDDIIDSYIKTLAQVVGRNKSGLGTIFIASYIKTLAQVVGSEEEARMKIYSVSTKHYYAFGALVSEELSYKLKELPGVRWVLPDSYLDVRNKDYGGEPFINGVAVPYDPKYHAEWVKNNARANERNRRNDRPRNYDRSRNFERRDNMQTQNRGGFQGNQGGQNPPPNNMGPANPPPNNIGPANPPPNMGPANPPFNVGPANPPPNNMGPANPPFNVGPANPPPNMGAAPRAPNMLYNNMGPNNMGPNNMAPPPNMRPNMGQGPPNNMGYGANNAGGAPNMGQGPQNTGYGPNNGQNFQYRGGPSSGPPQFQNNQYQNRVPPPQQNSGDYLHNFDPSSTGGNNAYQPQNVQGRDNPPLQNYQ